MTWQAIRSLLSIPDQHNLVRLTESGAFGMKLPCGKIITLESMEGKPVCFTVDVDKISFSTIKTEDIPEVAQLAFFFAYSAVEVERENSKK
jgi:hypothetical protein